MSLVRHWRWRCCHRVSWARGTAQVSTPNKAPMSTFLIMNSLPGSTQRPGLGARADTRSTYLLAGRLCSQDKLKLFNIQIERQCTRFSFLFHSIVSRAAIFAQIIISFKSLFKAYVIFSMHLLTRTWFTQHLVHISVYVTTSNLYSQIVVQIWVFCIL